MFKEKDSGNERDGKYFPLNEFVSSRGGDKEGEKKVCREKKGRVQNLSHHKCNMRGSTEARERSEARDRFLFTPATLSTSCCGNPSCHAKCCYDIQRRQRARNNMAVITT